jgi:excisionase family DNA binding protein
MNAPSPALTGNAAAASTVALPQSKRIPPSSDLLTSVEAAAYLRCHRITLYKLWHARKLKMVKIGGSTRWRRSMLDRYIEQQTRGAR